MYVQQCTQSTRTNRSFGFSTLALRSLVDTTTTSFLCAFPLAGDQSGGALPDPISNSEVKPSYADGTAQDTVWESR